MLFRSVSHPGPEGLAVRLSRRYDADLPVERVRDRLSAYVYGNILVLSAIGTTTPHLVEDGQAVVVVLATTITTYLAHVLSHLVGGAVGRTAEDHERAGFQHELRDAVPIISSGSVPALVLAVAWWTELDPEPAVLLASLVIVVRMASLGLTVGRLSGRPPTRWQLLGGLVAAVLAGVVVALKVVLLH